ncbi:MAG: competence/damage-inducible protein A [Paenibacillaceae bacterium]
MRAEIIAVGTELLMGQIVNSNAQYLSQKFAEMGVNVYYQTVVGDNAERMANAMSLASSRADLIVFTGGLGPTQDDITRDVLAGLFGLGLSIHQPSYDRIASFFVDRKVAMVESNARQALMIEGADPLMNDTGMAVGSAITHSNKHYVLLPGPPREMKPMFEQYARPWILSKMPNIGALHSRMLKFCGIGESRLEDELKDLITAQSDPSIAPYAKEGEVTIRLTTRSNTIAVANQVLDITHQEIINRVGEFLYADVDVPLETVIVRMMEEKGLTLSVAESCTGGLFSELITSIPGSSAMFHGGVICYSNEWKHRSLHIPMEMLEGEDAPGAVSKETAILLAEQIVKLTGSDLGISITGVAGPTHSERKPVGLIYAAIASKNGGTLVHQMNMAGNREMVRVRTVKQVMYELWKQLKAI